ncbi:hypothetical protein [Wenyingzhuangia sp. 2_MG-2023]|uniref:hypothetical protein n=1 Tax=Wenyingzhuangia sp. 2_MG-2023 TaxID=3062639 RepID=UPI0026E15AD3|nr:hypothetical protein [Wenyingzhuangia sp. 2_MG-2023]MDO6736964.1 hypothetical protein [Wenyingzhuangia sp. 2_MG-2023]MDO6801866.1 hypothetical protein [Wenyingzhuangia sp. 1_MG-2023]
MKYVKIILVFISVISLVSCGDLKAPEYVGVRNVMVSKVVNDSIVIKADLDFNNPNKIGGKISLNNLHAEVNSIDLGYLKNQKVKVPSKKNFYVPLELKLSYSQLFDSKKGLMSSILNSIFTNKIEVKLQGQATFEKLFVTKKYPINYSEKIKIHN